MQIGTVINAPISKANQIDKSAHRNNAMQFIEKNKGNLKSINQSSQNITKFEKEYSYNDLINGKSRQAFENNDLLIETDINAKPITIINKIKKNSPGVQFNGNRKMYVNRLRLEKQELDKIAETLANEISTEEKVFGEYAETHDGYIAYKWNRSYNGIKYYFDFILVVLDPVDGDIASVSKRFDSELPTNTIKLDLNQSIEIAQKYIKEKGLQNIHEIVSSEAIIINSKEQSLSSRFAYAITFNTTMPVKGTTTLMVDAENGEVLEVVATK